MGFFQTSFMISDHPVWTHQWRYTSARTHSYNAMSAKLCASVLEWSGRDAMYLKITERRIFLVKLRSLRCVTWPRERFNRGASLSLHWAGMCMSLVIRKPVNFLRFITRMLRLPQQTDPAPIPVAQPAQFKLKKVFLTAETK
jgi:hypothetical protein